MIYLIRYSLSLLCIVVLTACGDGVMKRTTYETLQNLRDRECNRHPSVECEERQSLEIYEEKRSEVE